MNLFICFTPLQLILAEKIIEQERGDKSRSFLFYYSYHNSPKEIYYYNRYSKGYRRSFYYNSKMSILFVFRLWLLAKRISKINIVYLASVEKSIVHFFISYLDFKVLNTFDDGTANITRDSLFYTHPKKRKVKEIIYSVLGKKYDLKNICWFTSQHYTIYPGYENITDKLIPLSFINVDRKENSITAIKAINIFIGSVYPDIVLRSEFIQPLQDKLINFINIIDALYLPHPRDTLHWGAIKLSNDKRVAEEVILELLQNGYQVNIYGFSSSSQFNVMSLANVKCYVIDSAMLKDSIKNLNCMAVNKGAIKINIDQ